MSTPRAKTYPNMSTDQSYFVADALKGIRRGMGVNIGAQAQTMTPAYSQKEGYQYGLSGVPSYHGQRVSEVNPLLQQYYGQAGPMADQQRAGLSRIAGGQAPVDALMDSGQRYAEDVLTPQVMERFAGLGTADSGGAAAGLGRTLSNFGLGLADQAGKLGLENQGQQLLALGSLSEPLQMLSQAGASQYDLRNQELQAAQQRWAEEQPYNNPWVSMGQGLLGNGGRASVQRAGGMGYSALTSLASNPATYNAIGSGIASHGGLSGIGAGVWNLLGKI